MIVNLGAQVGADNPLPEPGRGQSTSSLGPVSSLRQSSTRWAVLGIWEMTWSFSGPDGRATWEWTTVTEDGEELPAIRWRRIGNHAILRDP